MLTPRPQHQLARRLAALARSSMSSSPQQQQAGCGELADLQQVASEAQASAQAAVPRPSRLEAMGTSELVDARTQLLKEQAARGEQPGLTLMQDR